MRSRYAIIAVLCVAGCGPLRTYYAEGVTVDRLNRDQNACEVAALRDAPVATQVRQGPPRYIPRRYCDRDGHCYTRGYWVPGEIYSVDVNADLRNRLLNQCMGDLGYRPVEIPRCSSSVSQSAPLRATTILPALNENSCVIKNQDGTIQIVRTQ